jgi:hypothetical protein
MTHTFSQSHASTSFKEKQTPFAQKKEESTPFGDHDGSLLRQQPQDPFEVTNVWQESRSSGI